MGIRFTTPQSFTRVGPILHHEVRCSVGLLTLLDVKFTQPEEYIFVVKTADMDRALYSMSEHSFCLGFSPYETDEEMDVARRIFRALQLITFIHKHNGEDEMVAM